MNLSTLFRLEENLHLDKKTLVYLRWIAITGQLIAINLVYIYLNLKFPIIESHIIIFVGLLTNLFLQFRIKTNQLKDIYSSLFLLYDLFQLSALLYLTGGISNPFSWRNNNYSFIYSNKVSFSFTRNNRKYFNFSSLLFTWNLSFDDCRTNIFELFWNKIRRRNKKKIRSTK
jgi:hypothetical protein